MREFHQRSLVWLALFLIAGTCAASTGEERAQAAGASLIGTPAPRLVLKTIDGRAIDLGAEDWPSRAPKRTSSATR